MGAASKPAKNPGDASQPFFKSKRAAAVLKHALLGGYVTPFASKTGSASPGNRVVLVDGYAGAGRYDSGEEGSPALIAQAARRLPNRTIDCYFIEKDQATFDQLCAVLDAEDPGSRATWHPIHGEARDHLTQILEAANDVPLFLFLDPFGLGLEFQEILKIFAVRSQGFRPATEVLFRFDAPSIWRMRGVAQAHPYPAQAATLARFDNAVGGSWWRDQADISHTNEQYLEWFSERLLHELCEAGHLSGWITEVQQREGAPPAYYMIFLTRHQDGIQVFSEALSSAQETWRRAVFDEARQANADDSGQEVFLTDDDLFNAEEAHLADQWHKRIEQNVRDLLAKKAQFVVRDNLTEVFAGVLGIAREKHLRAALKVLHAAGVTSSDGTGKLYEKLVIRA